MKKITRKLNFSGKKEAARNYFLLSIGAVIIALNFHLFVNPVHIAPGGVTGLTIIINKFTQLPNGLILLVLQIPMLTIGFYNLGRFQFLTRTVYVVLIYSAVIELLAWLWPNAGITTDLLLSALFGGIVGGIGTGLIYRGRGTVGGTGIISRVIQLKTGIPVSQLYIMVDGIVILLLGLVFGWENALYAMIMLFVWGLAFDYVLEGPSVIRTAFIVTDRPRQVADELFQRTGLGITSWRGEGMFTGKEHAVLFCTVRRPDVEGLKSIVLDVDPAAFVVIGQGHQARGGVLREMRQAAVQP